jgi:hypothetical protein
MTFDGTRKLFLTPFILLAVDFSPAFIYPSHGPKTNANETHSDMRDQTVSGTISRPVYSWDGRTFHKVSKKYLPLYVAEFEFRYNNRMNSDIFGAAIAGC